MTLVQSCAVTIYLLTYLQNQLWVSVPGFRLTSNEQL